MADKQAADNGAVAGLGLAEAIGVLRQELLWARAEGAGADIQFPIESVTVELTVTATRSLDGTVGFKVPVIELGIDGGGSRERGTEQHVTVVFGAPVDSQGRSVKVTQNDAGLKG